MTWPSMTRADLGLEQRQPTRRPDSLPYSLLPASSMPLWDPPPGSPSGPSMWVRRLGRSQGRFATEQSSRCCTFLVGSDLPRGTRGISLSQESLIFFRELPSSCPAQGGLVGSGALGSRWGKLKGCAGSLLERYCWSRRGCRGAGNHTPCTFQGLQVRHRGIWERISAGPTLGPRLAGTGSAFTCSPAGDVMGRAGRGASRVGGSG